MIGLAWKLLVLMFQLVVWAVKGIHWLITENIRIWKQVKLNHDTGARNHRLGEQG